MIFFRFVILGFWVGLLFMGCKSYDGNKSGLKNNSTSLKEGFVEMSKTPCYGRCPVYQIRITTKGEATYLGKRNVEKTGAYHKKLNKTELDSIFNTFNNSGIWKMEDEYKGKVTDLPTTYLNFTYGGKSKNIVDYYNSPQELKRLEAVLEKIANSQGWIRDEVQPAQE